MSQKIRAVRHWDLHPGLAEVFCQVLANPKEEARLNFFVASA